MKAMNSLGLTRKQVAENLLESVSSISKVYGLLESYLKQEIRRENISEAMASGERAISAEALQASMATEHITVEDIAKAFAEFANMEEGFESPVDNLQTLTTLERYSDGVVSAVDSKQFMYAHSVVNVPDICEGCSSVDKCSSEQKYQHNQQHRKNMLMKLAVEFAKEGITAPDKQQDIINEVFADMRDDSEDDDRIFGEILEAIFAD